MYVSMFLFFKSLNFTMYGGGVESETDDTNKSLNICIAGRVSGWKCRKIHKALAGAGEHLYCLKMLFTNILTHNNI